LADALRAARRGADALAAYDQATSELEQLAKTNPGNPDLQDALGEALVRRAALKRREGRTNGTADEIRRGRELLEALPRDDPTSLVRVAAARLADGRPEAEALEALGRAVEAGLACPAALRIDPELEVLHDSATFQALLTRVEGRSKEARQ
jgi:hypothetical protein